jgi:hypothetical protein
LFFVGLSVAKASIPSFSPLEFILRIPFFAALTLLSNKVSRLGKKTRAKNKLAIVFTAMIMPICAEESGALV